MCVRVSCMGPSPLWIALSVVEWVAIDDRLHNKVFVVDMDFKMLQTGAVMSRSFIEVSQCRSNVSMTP